MAVAPIPFPIPAKDFVPIARDLMRQCGKTTQQCPLLYNFKIQSCGRKAGTVVCRIVARPLANPVIYCRGTLQFKPNKGYVVMRFTGMKCGRS